MTRPVARLCPLETGNARHPGLASRRRALGPCSRHHASRGRRCLAIVTPASVSRSCSGPSASCQARPGPRDARLVSPRGTRAQPRPTGKRLVSLAVKRDCSALFKYHVLVDTHGFKHRGKLPGAKAAGCTGITSGVTGRRRARGPQGCAPVARPGAAHGEAPRGDPGS